MQIRAELVAESLVPQRVVDGRFQIAELFTGVVATTFEDITVEVTLPNELAQRVGQLNLAAGAALCFREQRENVRRKNVAADDRVVRWRFDLRLLDHVADFEPALSLKLTGNDSIALCFGRRHFHQRNDRPSRVFEHAAHLHQTRIVGEDHIVRQ